MTQIQASTKTFVTSFSQKHYDVYAKSMLESVIQNWTSKNIRLIAYYHGFADTPIFPEADFIEYRNLDLNKDRETFMQRNAAATGVLPDGSYNYRIDAIRFCHKVFAYCEVSEELIANKSKGWLIWLDADTMTINELADNDLQLIFPNQAEVVHLGRMSIDYSETGFVGWNLESSAARSFLNDIKNTYVTDEVFKYIQWHDSFVFERLLNIYKNNGLRAHNLSANISGLNVFENSILKNYFVHNKGPAKFNDAPVELATPKQIENDRDIISLGPQRYHQLNQLIDHHAQKSDNYRIIEIGTWNGARAIEMAATAFKHVDHVHYLGFDLFETASGQTDQIELNVKPHYALNTVTELLEEFAKKIAPIGKIFTFSLVRGNTNQTMIGHNYDEFDLAFIDGGHSYETVKNDYSFLTDVPVVVFDDYYSPASERTLTEEQLGIIKVFHSAVPKRKYVMSSTDRTAHGTFVHLAVVLADHEPFELSSILAQEAKLITGEIKHIVDYEEKSKRRDISNQIFSSPPSPSDDISITL